MMIILDACGQAIGPDDDAFYEAIRPFQEMERRETFQGPCEDDCQVTAIAIESSERFEPGYFDPRSNLEIDRVLAYYMQQGLYPQRLFAGPPGLPCGGLLANKRG